MRRFWNNLGITHKFSLIFILMLGFIVSLCALSYGLLSITYRQTVSDIEMSYKIQNLVLAMDDNIEKARRIKHEFSLTYLKTDAPIDPDNAIVALVDNLLASVSKQSEILKDLIARSHVSDAFRKDHININLYYFIANRCNTVFSELMELVKKMTAPKSGLRYQLRNQQSILQAELEKTANTQILNRFNQVQLHIKEYLLSKQRPFMQLALNQIFFLKKEVRDALSISRSQKSILLTQINAYAEIAQKTPQLDIMIQTKSRDFDLNTETLEPISKRLIQLAQEDVQRAQTENRQHVKMIGVLLLLAGLGGFGWVGLLALVIHKSITRNIVRLTHLASAFQAGNLEVQDRLENKDELGRLSESFNQMALRLKELVNGLENQVAARTRDLSQTNRALKKEITEHQETAKAKAKLESELRQIHKMEAIGTLAGGIAHDFNNILGIIMGNCELAMDDIPEWNPARLNLKEIKTASIRARDIVRQLLSFTRKSEDEKQPVQIHTLVKETIALLRATIPTTIEIRTDIPNDLGAIQADASQIHQVIINLCTNAAHAMETDGGILEIGLSAVLQDAAVKAPFKELKPGPYIQLTISDNGEGIDPEIIDRIFDPYFTTKAFGKGTGMGLSIVHGIITNHDGSISVYSEPGKGTTFKVLLPAAKGAPHPEAPKMEAMPGGDETILFVDDEESNLKIGQNILERLGYRVDTQSDATEALNSVRANVDRYDLIITDMTMPKLTGADLARQVLEIRPDMPIILCTGFSHAIDEARANMIGIRQYVEKPLDRYKLAAAVRRVLDET